MTCRLLSAVALAALSVSCGYHVSGHADLMPKTIKVIAMPAFFNATTRQRLPVLLHADVSREFKSRTRYAIVTDPDQADATLAATIVNFAASPIVFNPDSFRATGVQVVVTVSLTLTDRHTGKVLYSQPGAEFRERYEIATDPQTYFDESGTAIERLSRDVARSVVSAILENF